MTKLIVIALVVLNVACCCSCVSINKSNAAIEGKQNNTQVTNKQPNPAEVKVEYNSSSQLQDSFKSSENVTKTNQVDANNEEQDVDKVHWWKKSVYYHIYLRSFRDSNNDGNGDLRGVLEKLDYLKMIGVGTILMSPITESPMRDGGYDVTSYTAINPMFGTMQDFEDLVAGLKERDMHIVVDFIPNHVSIDHPWFKCSERALIDPENCGKYRDYFVWNNSTRFEGKYPTNWISVFGGETAWHKSPVRNEFFLSQFNPTQADLNLRNPVVREELNEVARFWFRKGVDGLRVDAMPHFLEDTINWLDEPDDLDWKNTFLANDPHYRLKHKSTFFINGTPEIVRDWLQIAENEFSGDRIIINEGYSEPKQMLYSYGSSASNRFTHLNFCFNFIRIHGLASPEFIYNITMEFYNLTRSLNWPNERGTISPWPLWNMDNHDNSHRVNKFGEHILDWYQWLGFMLPGSPNFYYGNEMGIHDAHPDDLPEFINLEDKNKRARYRPLMPWNGDEPSGGFSNRSDNWMVLPRNYKTRNVKTMLESTDKHNHLNNFLAMQRLRKQHLSIFMFGDTIIYKNKATQSGVSSMIFTIARVHEKFGNLLLAINLNNSTCEQLNLIDEANKPSAPERGRVALISYEKLDRLCGETKKLVQGEDVELRHLSLGPSQAVVVQY